MYTTSVDAGTDTYFLFNSTTTGDIGASINGTGRSWQGALDDVRIYNRELTANEVAELYAKGAQ